MKIVKVLMKTLISVIQMFTDVFLFLVRHDEIVVDQNE